VFFDRPSKLLCTRFNLWRRPVSRRAAALHAGLRLREGVSRYKQCNTTFSFSFSRSVLRYITQTGGMTPLGVFSGAFPGHKMQAHLLTAHGILFIWAVTYPTINRAQRCLTLVIKWVQVCPTWHYTTFLRCDRVRTEVLGCSQIYEGFDKVQINL
jgi:hypothetical protein